MEVRIAAGSAAFVQEATKNEGVPALRRGSGPIRMSTGVDPMIGTLNRHHHFTTLPFNLADTARVSLFLI